MRTKKFNLSPARYLAGLMGWLLGMTAQAAVTAMPSTANVAVDRATSFAVVWSVTGTPPVSSSLGEFLCNDQRFATGGGLITSTSQAVARAANVSLLTETVVVPMAVSQHALRAGCTSFKYRRSFLDVSTAPSQSGYVSLQLTSGQAAGFGVTRIALGFDDQTSARIVVPNAALKAQAELSYTGAGLLRGAWEVAEPPSTSGEPIFRTLQHLYQPLAGTGNTVLTSPALPTLSPGLHLLRLRLSEPAMGFDPPEIRYFVSEPVRASAATQPMVLLAPAPLAYLTEDTRFAWRAVAGAQNYLIAVHALDARSESRLPDLNGLVGRDPLEIARAVAQPAVAGVVLNAAKAETLLSSATRQHLRPGHAYLWRVQAVARDGVLLGESDWREMRMP